MQASDEEAQAIKERIIAARRKVHKTTGEDVAARWTFEEGVSINTGKSRCTSSFNETNQSATCNPYRVPLFGYYIKISIKRTFASFLKIPVSTADES